MNLQIEEVEMASFYSVVQYVPDAVRDERINIGVLTFGDGRVRHLFVDASHECGISADETFRS
ncbi:MAG TPA: DUF3037 domain-containing protein [Pirellulales bacterium]|nr:DUF3037 domain-containing protein [Pirellulales bacterium]